MPDRFSFEVIDALDYDELRPGYAPEAVAWVAERGGIGSGSTVVDLAAGTGQLSRRFAPLVVDLIAVEPAANMRAVLERQLPPVRLLDGTAESIPLEDRSADAVVVGNAFHHFERDAAFAETARVLRPGGALALFWAWPLEEEQLSIPGMREIDEVVETARASNEIATAYRSWTEPPPDADGFGPFERREFPVTHVMPSACLPESVRDVERRGVAGRRGQDRSDRTHPIAVTRPPGHAAAPRAERGRPLLPGVRRHAGGRADGAEERGRKSG